MRSSLAFTEMKAPSTTTQGTMATAGITRLASMPERWCRPPPVDRDVADRAQQGELPQVEKRGDNDRKTAITTRDWWCTRGGNPTQGVHPYYSC